MGKGKVGSDFLDTTVDKPQALREILPGRSGMVSIIQTGTTKRVKQAQGVEGGRLCSEITKLIGIDADKLSRKFFDEHPKIARCLVEEEKKWMIKRVDEHTVKVEGELPDGISALLISQTDSEISIQTLSNN